MHRSKLSTFVIDCRTGDLDAAAAFWSRALRRGVNRPQPADAACFDLCWADSFHTGSALMWSEGALRPDGVIAVTGSYAAGEERWGWRTELHLGEELVVRAFNVSPAGEERRAVESTWRRLDP